MNKPTREQFEIAIDWLRYNEGTDGEEDACRSVAEYLESMILNSDIRSAARKSGIPVKVVRQRLGEMVRGGNSK